MNLFKFLEVILLNAALENEPSNQWMLQKDTLHLFPEPIRATIVASGETPPRVQYGGTSWSIKVYTPTQSFSLKHGQEVVVLGREGLYLIIAVQ